MRNIYPTKKELIKIKKWPFNDFKGLIQYIKGMWNYADLNYFVLDKYKLELHTGGWSGNEDIIMALQKNYVFLGMFWEKSERGGHYYFDLNKEVYKSKGG